MSGIAGRVGSEGAIPEVGTVLDRGSDRGRASQRVPESLSLETLRPMHIDGQLVCWKDLKVAIR